MREVPADLEVLEPGNPGLCGTMRRVSDAGERERCGVGESDGEAFFFHN